MGGMNELANVGHGPVVGMDGAVFADVVAVIEQWRGIERQQPDRGGAEIGDIVELGNQAGEIADAVIVRIEERFDMKLIDDGVLVPQVVLGGRDSSMSKRKVHDGSFHGRGAMRQIA